MDTITLISSDAKRYKVKKSDLRKSSVFFDMLDQASGTDVQVAEESAMVALLAAHLQKGGFPTEPSLDEIKKYLGVLDKYDLSHLQYQVSEHLRQRLYAARPRSLSAVELAYFAGAMGDVNLSTLAVQHFGRSKPHGKMAIHPDKMTGREVLALGPICYRALVNATRAVKKAKIKSEHHLYWRFVAGCLEFEEVLQEE